ncbi:hypothetical protein HDU76_013013 [Blyttiomyces sp. JEL0837]|nr:hypothetical protein HDU76_013013 [Blyttiomyces sp. JEL0837]
MEQQSQEPHPPASPMPDPSWTSQQRSSPLHSASSSCVNSSSNASVRRRRSGWWDGKEDLEREKEKVKELVRHLSDAFDVDECEIARLEMETSASMTTTSSSSLAMTSGNSNQNQNQGLHFLHNHHVGISNKTATESPSQTPPSRRQTQPESLSKASSLQRRNSSSNMRALLMDDPSDASTDGIYSRPHDVGTKLPPVQKSPLPPLNESVLTSSIKVSGQSYNSNNNTNNQHSAYHRQQPRDIALAAEAETPPTNLSGKQCAPVRRLRRREITPIKNIYFGNGKPESESAGIGNTMVTVAETAELPQPPSLPQAIFNTQTERTKEGLHKVEGDIAAFSGTMNGHSTSTSSSSIPSKPSSSKLHNIHTQTEHDLATDELSKRLTQEFATKECSMKSRVNQLEGRIQQTEFLIGRQRNLIKSVAEVVQGRHAPQNIEFALVRAVLDFCLDHGLEQTAKVLQDEAPIVLNAKMKPQTNSRREILVGFLERGQFSQAIKMVHDVFSEYKGKVNRDQEVNVSLLAASFEDLLYVLNKYAYLSQVEQRDFASAKFTLEGVLKWHVEREIERGGSRAQWFSEDFSLLQVMLTPPSNSSANFIHDPRPNPYLRWDWKREISTFWMSATGAHVAGRTPLYSHALNAAFPENIKGPDADLSYLLDADGPVIKLTEAVDAYHCRGVLKELLQEDGSVQATRSSGTLTKSVKKKGNENALSTSKTAEITAVNRNEPNTLEGHQLPGVNSVGLPTRQNGISAEERLDAALTEKGKEKNLSPRSNGAGAGASGGNAGGAKASKARDRVMSASLSKATGVSFMRPGSSLNTGGAVGTGNGGDDRRPPRSLASSARVRSDADDNDRPSSSSYGGFLTNSDLEKLMPPISKDNETAEFAFSLRCGPVVGHIRALDVSYMPETRRIVAASSGGDDRSDKKISLWDVRSGNLLGQIDNGTHKPIVSITFHPEKPNLLLTADMEFDVKLWDWETGALVRCWKKHHTRVIWKIAFVPGCNDKAASCSGDQSIKIWDTSQDRPSVSSVHANEPFTSFVFCGDPSGQTLIASLSYCIRIYKMRTLTLVHTIQLKDLKLNKTPLTCISSHPLYDNYVILSCDNQLRLFDLASETMLKVYSARELGSGTRIEGHFSPCGTFVYAGSWDTRNFAVAKQANRKVSVAALKANGPSESVVASGSVTTTNARGEVAMGGNGNGIASDASGLMASVGGSSSNGSSAERGAPEATGVYIWRVATGYLERSEMKAMVADNGEKKPVAVCKWIKVVDESRKGTLKERKVLIAATLDRVIDVYM